MNNTPENKVKTAVKHCLDKYKPELFYFSVPASAHGKAGIADIVGCYKGEFFAIEVKSPEAYKKQQQNRTKAQLNFRDKVWEADGRYICVCKDEQVMPMIEQIKNLRGVMQV